MNAFGWRTQLKWLQKLLAVSVFTGIIILPLGSKDLVGSNQPSGKNIYQPGGFSMLDVSHENEANTPSTYPPDPLSDIPWSGSKVTVNDIQNALNIARSVENVQLGTSTPALTLPSQSTWDAMSENQKAYWLVNRERLDRSVHQLQGTEANVISVAQYYAEYLLVNNTWGHEADGRDPWERLGDNPAIGACSDFLSVAENLAVFVTTGTSIPLPVERSIYGWMYEDAGSAWGHRHMILWYPYNDNDGFSGQEGFMGIGRASGGPYKGPFSSTWPFAELIVMNVFDPCSTWTDLSYLYLPLVVR